MGKRYLRGTQDDSNRFPIIAESYRLRWVLRWKLHGLKWKNRYEMKTRGRTMLSIALLPVIRWEFRNLTNIVREVSFLQNVLLLLASLLKL